jgi:hypothetical protein
MTDFTTMDPYWKNGAVGSEKSSPKLDVATSVLGKRDHIDIQAESDGEQSE